MISDERLAELLTTTAMPPEMVPVEPAPEPMGDDEFKQAVRRLVEHARSLMDENALAPLQRAWRYYNGEVDQAPMGYRGRNPETDEPIYEGSKQVLTECRDQVQTLLPEIYRPLAGSEEAIVFKPNSAEDTAYVEQANDYVRHIFWDRNNGEQLVKDGLLEWCVKYCAFRVWRENSFKEHVNQLEDQDETQLFAVQQDPNVSLEDIEPYQVQINLPQVGPDGSTVYVPQSMTLYRAVCRYREPYGRTRVELVPQDELLVDLEAQTLEEATVIGVDTERRTSDLIAMGLDRELVERMAGKGLRRANRGPDIRRHRANVGSIVRAGKDSPDDSLWWVRTVDARVLVDRDGDGIAEPWRIIALGDPLEIAEAVEDPGSDTIVVGSPFPRPHHLIGDGIVENTMDLQEIGTSIVRRTLDNFARSINPRPAVSGASQTMWDDLDSWYGGPIDLGPNGRIDWFQVPFKGDTAIPLLSFFGDRRTLRTGISPAAMGLDPNALKGQTVEGAGAIVAAPQSRAEGFAREFAARIMRPLFKAILQITVKYQDRAEVIRLRNEFVSVDPRGWNPDMDVSVEVGTGTRQERIAALLAIIAKQELLFTAKSKLFDLKKYRQALADLTHEMGTKDDERYFPEIDDEMMAQMEQDAERERQQQMQEAVQMQAAIKQAEEGAKAQAEIAVEQVKGQIEMAAKEREMALEHQFEQRLLSMEQMWKERLLRVESALEIHAAKEITKSMPQRTGGTAGSNGNVERRA